MVTHVLVPWTATKGETIVAAENIDIANFFKVGSHIAKKIIGSQNHFWQLAQAELVEFIPDTKSLAAKTNFGRILPKIFGTANFYFDFFSAFHFVLQRVTFKLNTPAPHTTQPTQHPASHNTISPKNKCNHRPPPQQSTGEKLTGPPSTI